MGGGGIARGISEEVASRIATVGSEDEGGVDSSTSTAGEAVWVGDLAPEGDEAEGEGLTFKVFGAGDVEDDEEDAKDILRKVNRGGACGNSNGAQRARGGRDMR